MKNLKIWDILTGKAKTQQEIKTFLQTPDGTVIAKCSEATTTPFVFLKTLNTYFKDANLRKVRTKDIQLINIIDEKGCNVGAAFAIKRPSGIFYSLIGKTEILYVRTGNLKIITEKYFRLYRKDHRTFYLCQWTGKKVVVLDYREERQDVNGEYYSVPIKSLKTMPFAIKK